MRGIAAIYLFLALVSVACSDAAHAEAPQLEPNPRHKIIPPYPKSGTASLAEIKAAKFKLTQCGPSIVLSNARGPYRTVTVTAPTQLDLLNLTIVNALVVEGLRFAWSHCFAQMNGNFIGRQDFSGVRILIYQSGELVFETARASGGSVGNVTFSQFAHHLWQRIDSERKAQERAAALERQRLLSEQRERDSRAFWAKARTAVGFIVLLGLAILLFWLAPRAIAFLRWLFNPHPATTYINAASQRNRSVPVDGGALSAALRAYNPHSRADTEMSVREMKVMTKKMQAEKEYLDAREELARKVTETELARTRVKTLERSRRG